MPSHQKRQAPRFCSSNVTKVTDSATDFFATDFPQQRTKGRAGVVNQRLRFRSSCVGDPR
jgi:hypothetical protein